MSSLPFEANFKNSSLKLLQKKHLFLAISSNEIEKGKKTAPEQSNHKSNLLIVFFYNKHYRPLNQQCTTKDDSEVT